MKNIDEIDEINETDNKKEDVLTKLANLVKKIDILIGFIIILYLLIRIDLKLDMEHKEIEELKDNIDKIERELDGYSNNFENLREMNKEINQIEEETEDLKYLYNNPKKDDYVTEVDNTEYPMNFASTNLDIDGYALKRVRR